MAENSRSNLQLAEIRDLGPGVIKRAAREIATSEVVLRELGVPMKTVSDHRQQMGEKIKTAMISQKSIKPVTRDKIATLLRLKEVLAKFRRDNIKISISAVAKDAKVSPSLIHHVYPDFAEEIRELMGRATRLQCNAKNKELIEARRIIANQKVELCNAISDIKTIASVNLVLQRRVDELEERLNQATSSFLVDINYIPSKL